MFYVKFKNLFVLIIAALLLFVSFGNISTYAAAPVIPESVKIGLSYGSTAANNFILKSPGGFEVSTIVNAASVKLFDLPAPADITIRKDVFYNIVNGKTTEINYVQGNPYSGELTGPYHIQIGDVYADINAAKQVAERAASVAQTVFLSYDGGWRVWSALYLDESECLEQIQLMKNEIADLNYSVILPDKKRIQIINSTTGQLLYILNAETQLRLKPNTAAGSTIPYTEYKSSKYRGQILLQRLQASDITVVNELPLEQYLYGVVPSEMPASWNIEALKAQAIVARNYTIANMKKHNAYGFDLCNTQDCQAYVGYGHESTRSNDAVNATKGKLLLYNGSIVSAYYHSSSGGYTEDCENVWSATVPYLKAVDDKYGLGSPYDNWVLQLSEDQIKAKMLGAKYDIGDILDITPLSTSLHGRVIQLNVEGTNASKQLVKENARTVLGYSALKSTWYTVKTDADVSVKSNLASAASTQRLKNLSVISAKGVSKLSTPDNKAVVTGSTAVQSYNIIPQLYTFTGKGWGHGLGMSQYGAKGMAEAGFNYVQILEHYFTGAKVQ